MVDLGRERSCGWRASSLVSIFILNSNIHIKKKRKTSEMWVLTSTESPSSSFAAAAGFLPRPEPGPEVGFSFSFSFAVFGVRSARLVGLSFSVEGCNGRVSPLLRGGMLAAG